jgi:hypothetical protein
MRKTLILSSALALLMATGAAYAGSSNTLYIQQSGSLNTANVHQSGAEQYNQTSSGNDIGTLSAPVTQSGTDNYLGYDNSGYGAGSDNDIVKLKQDGNSNYFQVLDSNGAAHTRINNVSQDGTNNEIMVTRAGEQYSTIDRMSMNGNNNDVWIRQGPIYRSGTGYGPAGGYNTISLVKVDGHDNGLAATRPNDVYSAGIWIEQTGSATTGGVYNTITEASIEGSNNPSFFGHAISIYQEGSYNGRTASIARMKGSNGNNIAVSEVGDWNNFDVRQGLSASSTGNSASVAQTGSYNSATATQYGNDNYVAVNQTGNSNISSTLFNGNGNGNGELTGDAGTLATANPGSLTEGTVLQDSSSALYGNMLDYTVYGSNNLFAFAQIGGNNTITGTVGSGSHDSNGNQVAVLQTGNSNTTSFSQTGAGSNNIAVSQ